VATGVADLTCCAVGATLQEALKQEEEARNKAAQEAEDRKQAARARREARWAP
jgi:hypothetical protein